MNKVTPASYREATGNIQYNMTNDYMFRYILQKNEKVLKGLVCALLHLKPDEIKELRITNPINLDEDINSKEYILDINVILNNSQILNLEMQVLNKHNWEDRSLIYLCRSFDQLSKGQEYDEAFPATHIGFLDYTLFPDEPEFYSTNMLLNVKTHRIFNSKFKLSVVDLTQIDLATEEDKAWGIDYWARLFKAKTWEELKMLAEKNEFLQEAAQSVYIANADDIIRQKCWAREENERHERTIKRDMQKLRDQLVATQKEKEQEIAAIKKEKDHEVAAIKKEKDHEVAAIRKEQLDNTLLKIQKKLEKGLSVEQIAEALEEDVATIEALIEEHLSAK